MAYQVEVIEVFVDYQARGDNGLSAYELAVSTGEFTGTLAEYLQSLRQPAEDAAVIAIQAADDADIATGLANTATSNANQATSNAIDATGDAIQATNDANIATGLTNQAISDAEDATQDANQATINANIATGLTNQAISDAQDATQDANIATGLANTATSNANTATNNANIATGLANQATQDANQATSNAEDATQDAINAANFANSQRGWTPNVEFEDYLGKKIKKLVGYVGGTGTAPTLGVGQYYAIGGGFTSDKSLAIDFKGDEPIITIGLNNHWFVDGVDTGQVASSDGGMSAVYGVEYNSNNASPILTRLGDDTFLHAELPVQSLMRRCILNVDRTVNYYLDADDSTKKEDGTPADLSGADGQFMVEIPAMYALFQMGGTIKRAKISLTPFAGSTFYPKRYISVSHTTVQRSTNKMMSVVNSDTDFAGGGASNLIAGVARTAINRADGRTYARNLNANWDIETYTTNLIWNWLYIIEYAHFNAQLPFNSERTPQGYKQGGLGGGVTNVSSAAWDDFNNRYAFVPIGYTASLGNHSGEKELIITDFGGSEFITSVPSYRGIENPFGHIFSILDGIQCFFVEEERYRAYVTDDRTLFSDTNHAGFRLAANLPMGSGYITKLAHGPTGDLITTGSVGGSATTYMCDYYYAPSGVTEYKWYAKGGLASYGATAGLGCVNTSYRVSNTTASYGFRLCCLAPS